VKARQVIAETLSAWRPVQHAPDLAHETFARLDADERDRLALRAYTEEIRQALRRKDKNGVPVYTSVTRPNAEGRPERVYKQTALFDVADYETAVGFYLREARANTNVARMLVADCARRLGVQIDIWRAS
jgi:hypothetical protein